MVPGGQPARWIAIVGNKEHPHLPPRGTRLLWCGRWPVLDSAHEAGVCESRCQAAPALAGGSVPKLTEAEGQTPGPRRRLNSPPITPPSPPFALRATHTWVGVRRQSGVVVPGTCR